MAGILGTVVVGAAAAWCEPLFGRQSPMPEALTVRRPRVVVVKSARTLYLFDGSVLLRRYPITLGPQPVGQKERAGDGRTPEGAFRVCSKNAGSANHRFLGIDYPNRDAARRGLRSGLISAGEALAIGKSLKEGRCPPWTSALGGAIGLHGSAGALERSAGCVALLDEHVAELFEILRIGDPVEILP